MTPYRTSAIARYTPAPPASWWRRLRALFVSWYYVPLRVTYKYVSFERPYYHETTIRELTRRRSTLRARLTARAARRERERNRLYQLALRTTQYVESAEKRSAYLALAAKFREQIGKNNE